MKENQNNNENVVEKQNNNKYKQAISSKDLINNYNSNKLKVSRYHGLIKFCCIEIIVGILAWILVIQFYSYNEYSEQEEGGYANYPHYTDYFYINDYSQVLTEETEQFIFDEAVKLQKKTTAQVVVVTIPDTGFNTLEDYSLTLANEWEIGSAQDNNGILITFTTFDPHVRIEVGKGLNEFITNDKAGEILDNYAVDDKNALRWNKAALNTFVAVATNLYKNYNLEVPPELHYFDNVTEFYEYDQVTTMADASVDPIDYDKANSWTYLLSKFISLFIGLSLLTHIIIVNYFDKSGPNDNDPYNSNDSDSSNSSDDYSGDGGSFDGDGASR